MDRLVFVHGKIFINIEPSASTESCAAQRIIQGCCFLEFSNELSNAAPNSLEEIFHFSLKLRERENTGCKIIVLLENSLHYLSRFICVMGCYLILCRGLGFEEALLVVRRLDSSLPQDRVDNILENRLRAVCCAKCLNWIDFIEVQDEDSESELQVDECMHYARCGPACVHTFARI